MTPQTRRIPYVIALLAAGLLGCGTEKPAPATAPVNPSFVSSIEPLEGAGNESILAARYTAPAGQTIRETRVLLNSELDGRNACYVYHSAVDNAFLLVDDSGVNARKAAPGGTKIENSQCALDLSRSSALTSNNILTLTLVLKFKPAFVGKKQVFLYDETSDGANSGLIPRGKWNVTF
jgi:hypothetical protein